MKKILATICAFSIGIGAVLAEGLVVISSPAKLYDQPNIKGYATLNRDNQEVTVSPGMVFKCRESKNGWSQIEYVPGISAFVMDSHIARSTQTPSPGTYKMNNGDSTFIITNDNGEWKMTDSATGTVSSGKAFSKGVVFFDKFGNPSYTLTRIDGKTYLYTYDPKVTKFL